MAFTRESELLGYNIDGMVLCGMECRTDASKQYRNTVQIHTLERV